MESIEKFLDLSRDEIEKRIELLRDSIPTKPGNNYLRVQTKRFEVQPWPFLSYLAHNVPRLLSEGLEIYVDYDGAENYQAIMEGLREEYIIWELIERIEKEIPSKS
jgi:hypothetical protein